MGVKLYERKPFSETVVGKSARKLAMLKAGIDPRTDAEKKADTEKMRQAKRWLDKTGGHIE